MGRAGYFGCLVLLGVALLSISCLAVFGSTGAITAERGSRVADARPAAAAKPTPTSRAIAPAPTVDEPREPTRAAAPKVDSTAKETVPPKRDELPKGEPTPAATKPQPAGTIPPKPAATGPEGNIAQRLDREAVGGGLKLRALGAAKTTQGDRAVLAIYVRVENEGSAPVRVDPRYFQLVDRAGNQYPVSRAVEASLPAIELGGRSGPGQPGQNTEGNLTFELPRSASGLALVYEPPEGPTLRIPLPPEFG